MRRDLIDRIDMIEELENREFLYKVITQLELEFPENEVRIIETLEDLISIRFGKYSVLITQEEIDMLKDIEDPYGLDRYLLAHFLKDGLIVDPESSDYLKHIFGMYPEENRFYNSDDY